MPLRPDGAELGAASKAGVGHANTASAVAATAADAPGGSASASQRSLSEQMLQSSLQLTASTSLANSYGDCSNRSVNAAPPLSSDAAATKTLLYDYRNRSAGGVSTPRRTSSPER